MPPGQTTALPLALTRSGLEEQEEPWPSLEVRHLELHPSPCENTLGALGQVFCPLTLLSSSVEQGLTHTHPAPPEPVPVRS